MSQGTHSRAGTGGPAAAGADTVAVNRGMRAFDDAESLWLFGYGSLLFKAGFPYLERRPATITGWSRRLWQGSHDHRGTCGRAERCEPRLRPRAGARPARARRRRPARVRGRGGASHRPLRPVQRTLTLLVRVRGRGGASHRPLRPNQRTLTLLIRPCASVPHLQVRARLSLNRNTGEGATSHEVGITPFRVEAGTPHQMWLARYPRGGLS